MSIVKRRKFIDADGRLQYYEVVLEHTGRIGITDGEQELSGPDDPKCGCPHDIGVGFIPRKTVRGKVPEPLR